MRAFILWCAFLLCSVYSEVCQDVEMIYNGDFEQPALFSSWSILAYLPGGHGTWSSTPPQNGFHIWKQGASNSPSVGPDGNAIGQHLEINGNSQWSQITYDFNLPCLLASTKATFSFLYWQRPSYVPSDFGYSIKQVGKTISSSHLTAQSTLWNVSTTTFDVRPCEPLTVAFISDTMTEEAILVDNVSLVVTVCESVDMASGGDFESPVIARQWETVSALPSIRGFWTSYPPEAGFVLWQQGVLGSPSKNSYENPTGQHLQINGNTPKAQIGYIFYVPHLLGVANTTLSFQYWFSHINDVEFFGISVVQGHTKVLSSSLSSVEAWTEAIFIFQLQPVLPAQVYFTCNSASIGGVHIDSMSLAITEYRQPPPPEPEGPILLDSINTH